MQCRAYSARGSQRVGRFGVHPRGDLRASAHHPRRRAATDHWDCGESRHSRHPPSRLCNDQNRYWQPGTAPSGHISGTPRGRRTQPSVPGDSWCDISGQADAYAAGWIIRREMIAVIGPDKVWRTEPRTAAKFAFGAIAFGARRAIDGRPLIIRVPAILGPLKHIAQHVVEAE